MNELFCCKPCHRSNQRNRRKEGLKIPTHTLPHVETLARLCWGTSPHRRGPLPRAQPAKGSPGEIHSVQHYHRKSFSEESPSLGGSLQNFLFVYFLFMRSISKPSISLRGRSLLPHPQRETPTVALQREKIPP